MPINETQRFFDHFDRVNVLSDEDNGFWYNHNKVAVDSWGRANFFKYPVSELKSCDICGRVGTHRRIIPRFDGINHLTKQTAEYCHGIIPEEFIAESGDHLLQQHGEFRPSIYLKIQRCKKCHERLKPVLKAINELQEAEYERRVLRRIISNEKLNKNDARTTGISHVGIG